MKTSQSQGFSIVEGLLVMTLVGILFLTSFPKFQSAGIASKVTQTKSDLALLQSGLQAYFADWRGYPDDHDADNATQRGLTTLTSPIPYLSHLPRDPFTDGSVFGGPPGPVDYEGASGCPNFIGAGGFGWPNPVNYACIHAYLLAGVGPDGSDSTLGNDDWPLGGGGAEPSVRLLTYNPTNGSESSGDIYRMMGEFAQGYFRLDHRIFGQRLNRKSGEGVD